MLNQKLRLSSLFQTSYFLPMVTSVTAVGLVWRWIFNREFGVLNALLGLFGVEKINWLQQASHSMTVLVVFGIWSALPFTIILLLSGLQNIDDTFYTVAKVDGARQMRIFRRITLPLLSPTIFFLLIVSVIKSFQAFNSFYALTHGVGMPGVQNLILYLYVQFYEYGYWGYGAAIATLLMVAIVLLTLIQWRLLGEKVHYS